MRAWVAATICLTAIGCGGPRAARPAPVLADYDQSCTTNADCAAGFVGDPQCCGGTCANGAVRTSASASPDGDEGGG